MDLKQADNKLESLNFLAIRFTTSFWFFSTKLQEEPKDKSLGSNLNLFFHIRQDAQIPAPKISPNPLL